LDGGGWYAARSAAARGATHAEDTLMSRKFGPMAVLITVMAISAVTTNAGARPQEPGIAGASRVAQVAPDSLSRALTSVAASRTDNEALIKSVIRKDEKSARELLIRHGYAGSSQFKINLDGPALGAQEFDPNVVYLAVGQPGHLYGQPPPPLAGLVHLGAGRMPDRPSRWVDWNTLMNTWL
jgi:hypothetical protein